MIGWQNTRHALVKLETLLTCNICSNLLSDPCSLQACNHIFCRNCIVKLVVSDSKCPECGAFAWVKDMQTNQQLANTVSMCTKMRTLVGSADDDDDDEFDDHHDDVDVQDKTHSDSETEATVACEETQLTFAQEMDSCQFSSPEVTVLTSTSMNKCDVALQDIQHVARNYYKKIPKEPERVKTYSHAQMKIATETKTTGTGCKCDVKQVKICVDGKVLICRNQKLSSRQEGIKENVSKESKSPKSKAKQKGRSKKKGTNDVQLIQNADVFHFGSQDENIITDKDEESGRGGKSFTRLKSKSSETPKAVESASKTTAQKRNLQGTTLTPSLKTLTQSEPDETSDLQSEMESRTATKNSKETPVKPQENNKRKTSEQHFHSPKNTTSFSPSVKKNNHGETPLHVAAIKGCVETVKKLLADGADPNTKDHAGWTPLHEACNHGYLTITELLLDYGALIDVPGGFDHDTPLHDAVDNGRLDIARLLVSKGAPLNVRNKQGLLPVDYARTEEMLATLSTSTPNRDSESATVASLVNGKGSQDLPKILLATGLNTEQKANLQKCANILKASIVNEFSLSVTHIVTATNNKGVCPRTIKYLNGVLTGKWIVSYEWILKSLRHKTWVDEAPHEVKGTNSTVVDTPRRARINSLKQLPGLFDGCQFYFSGEFHPPHPSKEDLIQMVKYGGGKILSREPKPGVDESLCLPRTRESNKVPSHAVTIAPVVYHADPSSKQYRCTRYIIYDSLAENKPHIWQNDSVYSMPSTWLIDCASNFAILDLELDWA